MAGLQRGAARPWRPSTSAAIAAGLPADSPVSLRGSMSLAEGATSPPGSRASDADYGRSSRSEESEVGDELCGGVDDLGGRLQCFGCFPGAGLLGWVVRVLQLVPPAAQSAEGPQCRAELGPDDFLDRVVAAGGGGAQALLGQEGDAGLPCGIIGEDDAAIGCRSAMTVPPPGRAVPGLATMPRLPARPALARRVRPRAGARPSPLRCSSASAVPPRGSSPATQTSGAERICWISGSAAAIQRYREHRTGFTGSPRRCSARSAASYMSRRGTSPMTRTSTSLRRGPAAPS